jgi:DNA mismatch repair ATPase MutS
MLATIDILFAKAIQAVKNDMSRPHVALESTSYTQLFNPWVKNMLKQLHKTFQPVDISISPGPCLVTGANMGGKTVLLKTVALAQYLFQFGFYIPAKEAAVVPVDDIMFSMGDDQSELSGLSSFAAEMMNIDQILLAARSGKKILALVDEPARTTNPSEGRAIVNAIITLLAKSGVRSLVTTHYSNISASCRKLRVKGLLTGQLNEQITVSNINNYMDYSLLEHDADDVPLEALRIAEILGIDKDLIRQAAMFLKQNS